jgi:glycosyltransferase involved in cell wall biosynthesis
LKISVITVTYNSAETVEQTILSVLGQTHQDVEYIIIDGGSTDDTLSIINRYGNRISKVVSEKDNGLYDALNKGIALASGEVIGILHSDDFYTRKDILQSYAQIFLKEEPDAVYSDLYYVHKTNTDKIIRKWKSGSYRHGSFLYGWMPPHPTLFVRRRIYSRYGGFNLQLKSAADYELMLRFIHKQQIRLAYLPVFTVKMRVGGRSNETLGNRLRANREDRLAWKINGLRPGFYTLYLKPLRKIFQFFRR